MATSNSSIPQSKSQFANRATLTPENLNNESFNIEKLGWWIYLLAIAMVPASYFFNGIVTEYYWGKTLWSCVLFPTSILLALANTQKRKFFVWHDSRVIVPYLVFVAVVLLSITWASNSWKATERAIQISGGFFALIGGLHYINNRRRMWQVFGISLLTATAITFYGLMQLTEIFYLPKDQYKNPDPSTTIGLTNFVVEYLITMIPLFLTGFLAINRDWLRMIWILGTSSVFFYFLVADNRAGYLSLIAGATILFVAMTYFVVKRNEVLEIPKKLYLSVVGAIVLAGAIGLVVTPVGQKIVDRMMSITDFTGDASIRFRIHTWDQCINNMIPDNLLLGVGFANIEVEFPRYYTQFLEGMTLRHNTRVVRAHNEYVQMLVDLGIIGLLPFLWFMFGLFRTGVDISNKIHTKEDFVIGVSLSAGIVAFLTNAFFAFPLQVPSSSINFFVFVVLFDRFRFLVVKESGDPTGDRTIKLVGPLQFAIPVLMVITFVGQAWATNYSYHALYAEVRNKEARVYKRYKKWDETLQLMHEAVDHNKNMEGYWYDRAVALMHFKGYEEALDNLLQTKRLVPNYAMGRKQIGVLAAQLGKTELAVNEYRATMNIFKSQREELTKLIADTSLRRGRPDLLLPVLEEGFALGFTGPFYQLNYANALAVSKRYPDAINVYEVLLKDAKNENPGTLSNYATALMNVKRNAEARKIFEQVTAAQPNNPKNWYNYARLLAHDSVTSEAKEALAKALALQPKLQVQARADAAFKNKPEYSGLLQ